MQLVIDANVLVAESLRLQGRKLLSHPGLVLLATNQAVSETAHELRRRLHLMVERGRLLPDEARASLAEAEAKVATTIHVIEEHEYTENLAEASIRIPRDFDDAPSVALALASDCGIWTNDRDFFGCGVPVWSTDVLRRYLAYAEQVGGSVQPLE